MKITLTKEIDLTDAYVNISLDLKKETFVITLSYTCPECAGHGCRKDNKCYNGTISMKLDPSKIDRNLDTETCNKLRSTIKSLADSF